MKRKNIKGRMKAFRVLLVTGALSERQQNAALFLGWFFQFLLGIILASVKLLGDCGPFGIAAAACSGAGLGGLFSALGAACGYLATFGFQQGIKYVSAVVLVFAAGYTTQDLKLRNSAFFMPVLAAFFTLLTSFLGYYASEAGQNMILPLLIQTVLALGCTYFFHEALSFGERMTESAELRHGLSLFILFSVVLMAAAELKIMQTISFGRILSILLVLITAFRAGPFSGSCAGLLLGLAMDAVSGAPLFYSLSYAFSAMVSGVFSRHGRLLYLLSYLLSGALLVFCFADRGIRAELLIENFVASVVFTILPGKALNLVGSLLKRAAATTGEAGIRRYTARRIARLSAAFQDLYATVDAALSDGQNEENTAQVFDRASELVCSRCKRKSECWNSAYLDTLNVFNDVTALIRSRGHLRLEDLPEYFRERCIMPQELIGAVNGEIRALSYRKQFSARLSDNRRAAYQQYLDLSEILIGASEELENAFGPDLLAQRRLSRYLTSIDLEADSCVFRDRSGRLHILLESAKLWRLIREPGYLDRLSEAVGVRLCRPNGSDEKCEGRITLMEAEPLTVSVGVASIKKTGESVSGDRGTYFKTEQGVLCILLSDGMGSGESAAKESVAAVRILERFLRTGVDPAVAMRVLNSVMLLKNADGWGFATVDLLCIDLFSGDAAFYKYGAAPSYVRAGKQIRRVRCENMAAGLGTGSAGLPDIVKMRLHPGNLALIASDGVLAETEDGWIRSLLAESETEDMKGLARDTLQTAIKQYGCSDDMTVLALRVSKRG